MQTVQVPKQVSYLLLVFSVGPSRSFTDPETQRESLLGGTNSFAGQFIHPSLAQSSRSIQHMQTVQVPKQDSHLLPVFCGTKSQLHRSRNSGREFAWWNQLLCRSFLIPISFTKLKIDSTHADSPDSKTSFLFSTCFLCNQDAAFQIKKLRKRVCWVEPTPLQISSYIHLLHKAQDPFSVCRQSRFQNKILIFYLFSVGPSRSFTDQETQEDNQFVESTLIRASSYIVNISLVQKILLVHAKIPGP